MKLDLDRLFKRNLKAACMVTMQNVYTDIRQLQSTQYASLAILDCASQATLLPLLGLPPPLDLCRPLLASELALEFSGPPSVSPRGMLTSGFAGLTSRGLFTSCVVPKISTVLYSTMNVKIEMDHGT